MFSNRIPLDIHTWTPNIKQEHKNKFYQQKKFFFFCCCLLRGFLFFMFWCWRCVEFTAKAEQFFIIQMLALMSPSMRDSVIRCRNEKRGKCLYFKSHKNIHPRAPIAFTPSNFSSLLLFIIVMCTEMGGRKARKVHCNRKLNWQNLCVYRWNIWRYRP